MGARARTRAKLNVRPRPLVVNATGAIQKNNTPVDLKPRTHTKQAITPISKCSQLSLTHAIELATLKCSLLDAVSHLLSPTSLFFSVFLHVFAFLFSRLEYLPQRLATLFLLNSSALLLSHFFLFRFPFIAKKISILNSSCLFLFFSSLNLQWISPRVCHAFSSFRLFFSLPQFPLSPSGFSFSFAEHRWRARGGSSALRPSPCCPRHGVRLPPERDRRCGRRVRHAHCLRVHASCRLGGLCQRGVETQAVTPSCPST